MKVKLIGLLIAVPLLLIGCDEEFSFESDNMNLISVDSKTSDSQTPTDLSIYPENVANGTVSIKMYEESMRFIAGIGEHITKITDYQNRLNANSLLQVDEEFKKEYVAAIDELDVFIKGFYVRPSTDVDFELNKNFSELLYYYELFASTSRAYTNMYEIHYAKSAATYGKTITTSLTAFVNTLDKYKLFSDSE